jgi:hypothetical protein
MKCLFAFPLLAAALLAGRGLAQEPAPLGGADYFADAATPIDGNCPTTNMGGSYGGFANGGGNVSGGYGVHGNLPYPPHWGLAYASGYPNGVKNYGNPPYARDWKGPGLGCRSCSNGECLYRFYGQPDLFYNYWAWPSCTGLGAELYPSPRPTPPWVGFTYLTYQPLYPHEFMYQHCRTYHRYYNGGQGLNRTCVKYSHSWLPWY